MPRKANTNQRRRNNLDGPEIFIFEKINFLLIQTEALRRENLGEVDKEISFNVKVAFKEEKAEAADIECQPTEGIINHLITSDC